MIGDTISVAVIPMADGTYSVSARGWMAGDPKAGTIWEVRRRVVAPPGNELDGAAVARLLHWVAEQVASTAQTG